MPKQRTRTPNHFIRMGALTSAAILTVVLESAPAFAQSGLEEIVVTTRKRAENIQEIPISITALTDEQIQRAAISDLDDIVTKTTALTLDQSGSPLGTRLGIRGLTVARGRPNAAILVDGIDVTTEGVTFVGAGMIPMQRLMDVERIEVVKGPQSALYGRSAFAGAIQYITKAPSDTFEGRFSVNAGTEGHYEGAGSVSGPVIADRLSVRLNASLWSDRGSYRDQATKQFVGGGDGFGAALSTKFTPSDSFTVRTRLEYTDQDKDQQAQASLRTNTTLTAPAGAIAGGLFTTSTLRIFLGPVPDGDTLQVVLSPNPRTGQIYPGSKMKLFRGSLIADWDTDYGTLSSLTGVTRGRDSIFQDGDQDAVPGTNAQGVVIDTSRRGSEGNYKDRTNQFSEELRYSSKFEGPVQVTVGGLYWHEFAKQNSNTISVSCTATGCPAAANFSTVIPGVVLVPGGRDTTRNLDHTSAYGMFEWQVIESLKFTAELRYSHEKEEVVGQSCALPRIGNVNCADPGAPTTAVFGPSSLLRSLVAQAPSRLLGTSSSENFSTPRFSLEFTPEQGTLIYVSAAKGVKPGGTSTVTGGTWIDAASDGNISQFQYQAEKLWVYEVGAKREWFDNRLVTNGAFFYQDYKDKQVVSLIPIPNTTSNGTIILNAGQARVYGFEFDGTAKPTEHLTLSASYTYLDTKYKSFDYLTSSSSEAIRNGNCTVVTQNGQRLCQTSLTGKELEAAAKNALSLGFNYTRPASAFGKDGWNWFIEGDARYQDKRWVEAQNLRQWDDYWLANLRVGLNSEAWEVLFYVDNVFDDRTIRGGVRDTGTVEQARLNLNAPPDVLVVTLPEPRTFGIRTKVSF